MWKRKNQCLKTLTQRRKRCTLQCSCWLIDVLGPVSDGPSASRRSTRPNNGSTYSICSRRVQPSWTKTHFTKDEKQRKSTLCRKVRESGVSLWTIVEAQRPETSHELWLLFLLCLLLICVIWVSIKRYEMQSVQIDMVWAIFIHLAKIQPL